jgi:ferredoxin
MLILNDNHPCGLEFIEGLLDLLLRALLMLVFSCFYGGAYCGSCRTEGSNEGDEAQM